MNSEYAHFCASFSCFSDLSVKGGTSLLDMSKEQLQTSVHAWNTYIDRLSTSSQQAALTLLALARLRRAFALLLLERFPAVLEDTNLVLAANVSPREEATARLLLAYTLSKLGQHCQALDEWNWLLPYYMQHGRDVESLGTLYLERALTHGELAHFQQTLADCKEAERYLGERAIVLSVRGLAQCYLGEGTAALRDCTTSLHLTPSADGYYRRGLVFSHLTRYHEACEDFTRALLIQPDANDIKQALGMAKARERMQWLGSMFNEHFLEGQ